MGIHQRWLENRKILLQQIKENVRNHLGGVTLESTAYAKAFYQEFQNPWKVSSKKELLEAIRKADIIFGADFHGSSQAQKTHLRLLRQWPLGRPVVLALEAFSFQDQNALDMYLHREISEAELLRQTQWKESWGFPWDHYRPLVQLCRRKGWRILGIDDRRSHIDPLSGRDRRAAELIAQAARDFPEAVVYVIFGEWHITENHLPFQVTKILKQPPPYVLIFQNSEKLYFDLAQEKQEANVDVMRASAHKYCINGAPPWVQWQSYLMFLEQSYDTSLDDEEEEDVELDFGEHIGAMVRLLSYDLCVDISLNEIEVYSSNDETIWRRLKKELSPDRFSIAEFYMENDWSFMLPSLGIAYLSRASVNHAAGLAGYYIHWKLCGLAKDLWNLPQDFLSLVWWEAVAFFMSKMVNHKRVADTLSDIRVQLKDEVRRDKSIDALKLTIHQRMSEILWYKNESSQIPDVQVKNPLSYVEAAKILGSMMGEKLYFGMRQRVFSIEEMVTFMSYRPGQKSFGQFYKKVVTALEAVQIAEKSKMERV